MHSLVKTRTMRKGERGTPQLAPNTLKPSPAKLPAEVDENGQLRTAE